MPITAKDIQNLVQPLIDEEQIKLCEAKVSGSPRRPLIQLFIDREEGFITIDDCVSIIRSAQDILSMQDNVPSDYRLEVSSPGIDFPMRELWQFKKNIGRMMTFKRTTDADLTVGEETGTIHSISDNGIVSVEVNNTVQEYTLTQLEGARVVIESPGKRKSKRKRHETRRR